MAAWQISLYYLIKVVIETRPICIADSGVGLETIRTPRIRISNMHKARIKLIHPKKLKKYIFIISLFYWWTYVSG